MSRIHVRYIWFFAVFFVIAALEPLALLARAETAHMAMVLLRYLSICFVLGMLGLVLAKRYLPRFLIFFLALGFVGTFASLRISHYPAITGLGEPGFVALVLLLLAGVYWGLSKLTSAGQTPTAFAYACLVVIGLSSPILTLASDQRSEAGFEGSPLMSLKFQEKPNIYLLSYDSFIPQSVAQKYLQVEELPYQSLLNKRFWELPNSLSFHVPSRPSINNLMRLGQSRLALNPLSFSGNAPSLLQRLVQANGYRLSTGFSSLYFGGAGPHVDEPLFPKVAQIESSVLCVAQGRLERIQGMLVCKVAHLLIQHKLTSLYRLVFGSESNLETDNWHGVLLDRIASAAKSKQPVFTYLYTYNPIGHTSLVYDHSDSAQRETYKGYFMLHAELLAAQLSETVDKIAELDPDALLIVFGDHGAYLSRSVSVGEDPQFFFEDRHRVVVAVGRTEHKCAQKPPTWPGADFNTPSRVLTQLLLCLSGRQSTDELEIEFDEPDRTLRYSLP